VAQSVKKDVAPPFSSLTVCLVGAFRVEVEPPQAIFRQPTGKAARVLTVLAASADEAVSVSDLTSVLWPDGAPHAANRNIAALVSRLRQTFGRDAIRGDAAHGYRLVTSDRIRVDMVTARELCMTARRESAAGMHGLAELAAATAEAVMSRGRVLADEDDAEWAEDARRRGNRLLRRTRAQRWTAALACSNPDGAIASAEPALADDPLDEDACRALMTGLYQAGSPGAALSVYEDLRAALADTLGIDPAEQTQSLYLSILHAKRPGDPTGGPSEGGDPGRGRIIGRDREMATLVELWSETIAGRGGIALVLAAAGMGKRTLVDALATRVGAAGGTVLHTTCDESERSLYLQPLIDVVRTLLLSRTAVAARELFGDAAAPFAELIADVGHVLGQTPLDTALPEARHRRVLEAFVTLLTRLVSQKPALLVVEALEHAGDSTLEALHFIASAARAHRLLIVATVDAADSDRVTTVLGSLAQVIRPGPLSHADVAELLRRANSPLDGQRLLDLTAGSPLYLTELVRQGTALGTRGGDRLDLSDALRSAVGARLNVVGPDVLHVLQLAAMFGDSFTLDEVAELGQMRVEDCARHIQRALRADLIVARRSSFSFANKILREVLYQAIPEPVRLNRHRRAAQLLVGQPEAAATHWAATGAWAEAVAAWRTAAESAHRALSNTEAERLLTNAEAAAAHLPTAEQLAEILIRRGQLRCDLGAYASAHDDHSRALAIARDLMDESLEARALEQLGWTALYARDAASAADLAAQASTLAEDAAAAPAAPRSAFLLLGRVRHWDGDYEGAADAYAQVVAGSPGDEIAAQALTYRGAVLQHVDRFAEARRILAEAVVLCRANGLVRPLLQALFFTALSLGDTGDFSRALRHLERARRLIDDNSITYYRAGVDTTTSWLLRETGHLGEAREVAERAVEAAERGGGALELEQGLHAVLALAECELNAGRFDDAGARVEAALPFLDQPLPYRARAQLRLVEMQARFEPARAEELLELARSHSSPKYQALAMWHLGSFDEAARIARQVGSDQLLAQVGDPNEAAAAIDRLAVLLPREDRERFMATGRLPQQWRVRTGRVG
jgi:DNA-binding SARP family transcriptional activator